MGDTLAVDDDRHREHSGRSDGSRSEVTVSKPTPKTEPTKEPDDLEFGRAMVPPFIDPTPLPPPEKLAMDTEDVVSFLDHFHQHPDKPDLDYDAQPPG
jgi:hypothetical protein